LLAWLLTNVSFSICDIAMSFTNEGPLQFVVEWYDAAPKLKRQYILKYYTDGNKNLVEMVDIKAKKIFLKKCPCPPELSVEDIYIGSKFLLFSRELEVVDYGDSKTRKQCQFQLQPSTVVLGSGVYQYWGRIIDKILSSGLQIFNVRTMFLTDNMAEDLCDALEVSQRQRGGLVQGPCLAIFTQGEDGVRNLFETCQRLAQDLELPNPTGSIFCASSGMDCQKMQSILPTNGDTATLDSCTCCLVKPHAVKAKQLGKILDAIISQGYEVSAIQMLQFNQIQATEFLEVYDGVLPTYHDHVVQLASGASVALEIRAEEAVNTFRVTAGPWDVQMAKELRPGTLRATFGLDDVKSAVHCTDLAVDGTTEAEYCFKLMPKK
jgi:nucleoside-diphosphate kinase